MKVEKKCSCSISVHHLVTARSVSYLNKTCMFHHFKEENRWLLLGNTWHFWRADSMVQVLSSMRAEDTVRAEAPPCPLNSVLPLSFQELCHPSF